MRVGPRRRSVLTKNTRRSLANDLTDRLRDDILTGRKTPGDYLRLQNIADEFEVSLSPIRESLSVLAYEGLVSPVGQRGYKVAPLLREDLVDATKARVALETLCLRASIEQGDDDWESEIVASFWKLNKLETSTWTDETLAEWEKHHHRFHESLIGGCGSPMLIEFCGIARRVTDRFRRICVRENDPDRNVWNEHETIFRLTIARRADEAVAALATHVSRTSERILATSF